jgi:diguanylate cyclase
VGDEVLRGIADVLREAVGEHGIAARYGGDELVVALPACTATAARAMGEEVRGRVQHAALLEACGEQGVPVTVSVGAAEGDGSVADLAVLVSAADKAMYRAKASGRNRVCGPED